MIVSEVVIEMIVQITQFVLYLFVSYLS